MSYTVLNPNPHNPPTYSAAYDPSGVVGASELAPACVHLEETIPNFGMLPIGLVKVEIVLISAAPSRLRLEVMIPLTIDPAWSYGTPTAFGYATATNPGRFVDDWNAAVPNVLDVGVPLKNGFLQNRGDRLVWEFDPSNPPLIIDDGLPGIKRAFGVRNMGAAVTGELQINYEWVVLAPRLA